MRPPERRQGQDQLKYWATKLLERYKWFLAQEGLSEADLPTQVEQPDFMQTLQEIANNWRKLS